MKPSRLLLVVASLAFTLLFTAVVPTASAQVVRTPTPTPTPDDTRKLIQAVDTANNTVTIQYMRNQLTHTYGFHDLTLIKVNGVKAKVADIKVGMQVRDYVERDSHTLDSITVDVADAPPGGGAAAPGAAAPKAPAASGEHKG